MKEQETHADIIAEMRGNEFDDPHLDRNGIIGARRLARGWADRLEAAHKRGRGDAAKLREALEEVLDDYQDDCAMSRMIRAALSAPPRNCDVHTADELKVIFKSELVSELPIANEHEKNLVTITAMGVIDTLFATTKEGGAE